MQNQSVIIVGGGGCGASVFVQLIEDALRSGNTNLSITVIGNANRFGPGLPYGTSEDSNVLNMKGQAMGIYAAHPLDFYDWTVANNDSIKNEYGDIDLNVDPFPPRSLYGRYLEQRMQEAKTEAEKSGISVAFLHGTVVDAQEANAGMTVTLKDGTVLSASYVVLAPGNFPSVHYTELESAPGYFHSPWPEQEFLSAIPKTESVCILGSRLTAVDTVLMLAQSGHEGKIFMVSRIGLLPKVQGSHIVPVYEQEILQEAEKLRNAEGFLSFSVLANILREQIERVQGDVNWGEVLHPAGKGGDIFLRDLKAAETDSVQWQNILSSTSNIIEDLWHWMPQKDREDFMQHFCSLWFTYRHAMPMKNARKIAALLQSGQLAIHSLKSEVSYDSKAGMFSMSDADGSSVQAKYAINATGEGLDVGRIKSELLQNLLMKKIISANSCGGVDVDFETCALMRGKEKSNTMYLLGSLTRGTHFYTNDIHRNAVHAKRIADDLLAKLSSSYGSI